MKSTNVKYHVGRGGSLRLKYSITTFTGVQLPSAKFFAQILIGAAFERRERVRGKIAITAGGSNRLTRG